MFRWFSPLAASKDHNGTPIITSQHTEVLLRGRPTLHIAKDVREKAFRFGHRLFPGLPSWRQNLRRDPRIREESDREVFAAGSRFSE